MNEEDLRWDDIEHSRNMLLSKSDWTQLPDSGLSWECVIEWREWRQKVRDVNNENYKKRIPAVTKLQALRTNQPKNVKGTGYSTDDNNAPVFTVAQVEEIVKTLTPEGSKNDSEPFSLDKVSDIKVARKYAQGQLDKAYREKISKVSPPPELNYLYMERLNEAVDFLAESGSYFPMLDTLSENLDKSKDEIATNILKKHTNLIGEYVNIENEYINCLKSIKASTVVSEIKSALEEFDGHRH